ncbi:Lrp/AsnC family transcriptional regulator [Pseudomonas sp. P66]|jgi:Lrp/AsnC family leucine-responsive transcriptional regulator|uniref:Lrp/AsnC family transcriptional regulator n=1 Tax=Pseudomonas arcuscaelestis TaxID=2710591 RepID=A0ABS2BT65_9PSED|nr:Lrp/AsnC family transcriptional regulator [Pseudomonas arcuscaelestis]MBM3104609.1 Lrp/AsnC family transcriptional regulator [Pseudomonas arcuscaelestis]MBM3112221.1 Lrp/AsnC family transcriptional regulator [Pseudomonas arcuscaelestis]MBM5456817.1 Lrp/AsnC family transcriptional regulator [Pseudomonas arcuscaelestis]
MKPALDDFDLALLDALQQDNSLALRQLAEQVHLSTASVQRRIQRLNANGVIQANAAVIDPEKIGQVITLMVEVHAERTQSPDLELMKQTFSGPQIQQCYYVTGDADFMLVLTVASMSEYQALTQRLFHDNPNVKWFRTIVVLERVKSTLQVPIDRSQR